MREIFAGGEQGRLERAERERARQSAKTLQREIAALADRMEADGDTLHNRGEWNAAVSLPRRDVVGRLAVFIDQRVLAAAGESEANGNGE